MNFERGVDLVAMWATPFVLLGTALVTLSHDPLWAGVTFWCSGCTFGIAFTAWARSRR